LTELALTTGGKLSRTCLLSPGLAVSTAVGSDLVASSANAGPVAKLLTRRDSELGADICEMELDCAAAGTPAPHDFTIWHAVADGIDDLPFGGGEDVWVAGTPGARHAIDRKGRSGELRSPF